MKLTGKTLLLKAAAVSAGAAGTMAGIRFLFFPGIPLLERSIHIQGAAHLPPEEALLNSLAIGFLIIIPSLMLTVCSVWFGMGIKWYYWSTGRHPLIASILIMAMGAVMHLARSQWSAIGLGIMGGGVLGALISYVFIYIEKAFFDAINRGHFL